MSNTLGEILNLRRADSFNLLALRRSCRENFINLALAVEAHDISTGDADIESRLNALVVASGTGQLIEPQPEVAFGEAWIAGFSAHSGVSPAEAAERDQMATLDWSKVRAPLAWISDVARACGVQDAINLKAWAAHCRGQEIQENNGFAKT